MQRRSTERFFFALLYSLIAVVVAVLIGRAAVVMVITPWFVLLTFGVAASRRQSPAVVVAASSDRVMVDDPVDVSLSVADVSGHIKATLDPIWKFESVNTVGNTRDHLPIQSALVGGDGPAVVEFSVPAAQWGVFDVGRISLEVIEPFGLTRWRGTLSDPTPIRVHPTPRQIKAMVGPRFVRRTTGTHASRLVDRGIEYADLRRFGPGDSLRDINWRVSARAPELWVSQRHPDRATDVVLLLDSFVESGHDAPAVVGLAVEAAVAVAESHLAVTDKVGLVEVGGLVRWVVPGTGARQLQRLVDALLATGLYASAAERSMSLISRRAMPPRSLVIALSPLLDRRFIDSLFVLAGRGHDIAVVECEPAGSGLPAESPPGAHTKDDPERAAVAKLGWRMWQAERSMMRDELAQHNVTVARWQDDQPIDVAIQELVRRRSRSRGSIRQAAQR